MSNKTKKAGYVCDGVVYAISGLFCTVLVLFSSNEKNSVLLSRAFPQALANLCFTRMRLELDSSSPPMARLIQYSYFMTTIPTDGSYRNCLAILRFSDSP